MPSGFTPSSVTFVRADLGWVLGTAPCSHKPCTSVLRTRDGGSSWTGIPAPKATLATRQTAATDDGVSILRFADATNGWAAGGALYSTHNGGATWVRQHIGPSSSVVSSIETGGGRVYALVDACPESSPPCTARFRVWTSPIGHDQWTQVAPKIAGDDVGDLVVHGDDWFLPTSAAVYHGSDGTAPTRLPNPCPSEEGHRPAAELATADSTHLDAVCGSDGAGGSEKDQVYGTTDGGRHWKPAGGKHLLPSGLYGVADNAHNVLLLAVASGTSTIARSTDDAAHLSNASVPDVASGGIAWADLGFTTPTQAVAVLVGKSMYLSHDSGAHFSKVHF